jgi:glyoxylase-like metal-dependent hydrolase (beta-lactamase superfamily II)
LIGIGAAAAVLGLLGGGLYALVKYAVMPMHDGAELAGGAITTVVTAHFGPIPIGAYLFELEGGGYGLVDAGSDPGAAAIRAALARKHRSPEDVRVVFFTHMHDDHFAGARAFPGATFYVPEPRAAGVAAARQRAGAPRGDTYAAKDGDRIEVFGTTVEIFALPGHTSDSIAVLTHGVLFLGDSAGAVRGGALGANTLLTDDPDRTVRSLRVLGERLASRRAEITHLAFGHQGPLQGLEPLLIWAETNPEE